MKKIVIIFVLTFASWACSKEEAIFVVPQENTNNPKQSQLDKDVHGVFMKYKDELNTVGLSIGIYKDGKTSFYGYGETQLKTGKVPDSNTYFEIGSITKTFTAIATMNMLLENGETIEKPIRPYLPSKLPVLAREGVEVNFKHLLTHTSGLPRMPDNYNSYLNYSKNDFYSWLRNIQLFSKPFEKMVYSNAGFGLLGNILEENYNKSYGDVMSEKVFKPLGLNATTTQMKETNLSNWAVGYADGNKTDYWESLNALNGAGVIKSTSADMVKYGVSNLQPPSNLIGAAMKETHKVTFGERRCLSWWLQSPTTTNSKIYLWHNGGTDGFNSDLYIAQNIVLVLLFNNSITNTEGRQKFTVELLDAITK